MVFYGFGAGGNGHGVASVGGIHISKSQTFMLREEEVHLLACQGSEYFCLSNCMQPNYFLSMFPSNRLLWYSEGV